MHDPSFDIRSCRGAAGGCRFALSAPDHDPLRELALTVAATGWPNFLRENTNSRINHHARLNLALAACPNGCSRPQVADFALVRARLPRLPDASAGCGACGQCEGACPDAAIAMDNGLPLLDTAACLACGQCRRACPEGAIGVASEGWRIMVGGKLGRRPRLAMELPGLHGLQAAMGCLAALTEAFMAAHRPGLRVADLVAQRGTDFLEAACWG